MTKKELALKTVAELRGIATDYGHKLASRLKSGIVDELAGVIKKTGKNLTQTAKKTSKKTVKTVKAVKKASKKASRQVSKTVKSVKKAAKRTSKGTARTIKAVKKAFAAGKKAAAQASKKQKTAPAKKMVQSKPATKQATKESSKASALGLKKKDLHGMTVAVLKETAHILGLKYSYPNKSEFVDGLSKDITRLRAEASKMAAKPATKKKPAQKIVPAAKKATAPKEIPLEEAKIKPAKRKVPKASKASAPLKSKLTEKVKPVVQALVNKTREIASQVRGKAPAIISAKPKIAKKLGGLISGKPALQDISIPRVAKVLPGGEGVEPPVELLAAIAVEPTELFVSWVLAPGREPSGPVVLRVFEEGDGHFDFPVGGLSGSAYIKVSPGRHYHVEAGMLDAKGAFTTVRRSNPAVTPPGDVQPLAEEGAKKGQVLPEGFFNFTPQDYGSN